MKNFLKQLTPLILSILFIQNVNAQKAARLSADFSLGVPITFFSVNPDLSGIYQAGLRYSINKNWSVAARFASKKFQTKTGNAPGVVSTDGIYAKDIASYNNAFYDLGGSIQFNMGGLFGLNTATSKFMPYATLGGAFQFWKLNSVYIDGSVSEMNNYGTRPNNIIQLGLGVRYYLNPSFDMFLASEYNHVQSYWLDGAFADKKLDTYLNTSFGLSYKIGAKSSENLADWAFKNIAGENNDNIDNKNVARLSVDLSLGIPITFFSVNPDLSGIYQAGLRYSMNKNWSVSARFASKKFQTKTGNAAGIVSSPGIDAKEIASYNNSFYDLGANIQFNMGSLFGINTVTSKFMPYATIGGSLQFWKLNTSLINGTESKMDNYASTPMNIVQLGLGTRYYLNPSFDLFLASEYNHVQSYYMDGADADKALDSYINTSFGVSYKMNAKSSKNLADWSSKNVPGEKNDNKGAANKVYTHWSADINFGLPYMFSPIGSSLTGMGGVGLRYSINKYVSVQGAYHYGQFAGEQSTADYIVGLRSEPTNFKSYNTALSQVSLRGLFNLRRIFSEPVLMQEPEKLNSWNYYGIIGAGLLFYTTDNLYADNVKSNITYNKGTNNFTVGIQARKHLSASWDFLTGIDYNYNQSVWIDGAGTKTDYNDHLYINAGISYKFNVKNKQELIDWSYSNYTYPKNTSEVAIDRIPVIAPPKIVDAPKVIEVPKVAEPVVVVPPTKLEPAVVPPVKVETKVDPIVVVPPVKAETKVDPVVVVPPVKVEPKVDPVVVVPPVKVAPKAEPVVVVPPVKVAPKAEPVVVVPPAKVEPKVVPPVKVAPKAEPVVVVPPVKVVPKVTPSAKKEEPKVIVDENPKATSDEFDNKEVVTEPEAIYNVVVGCYSLNRLDLAMKYRNNIRKKGFKANVYRSAGSKYYRVMTTSTSDKQSALRILRRSRIEIEPGSWFYLYYKQ